MPDVNGRPLRSQPVRAAGPSNGRLRCDRLPSAGTADGRLRGLGVPFAGDDHHRRLRPHPVSHSHLRRAQYRGFSQVDQRRGSLTSRCRPAAASKRSHTIPLFGSIGHPVVRRSVALRHTG